MSKLPHSILYLFVAWLNCSVTILYPYIFDFVNEMKYDIKEYIIGFFYFYKIQKIIVRNKRIIVEATERNN